MASKTVKVKKRSQAVEEWVSGGVITPGMLVDINSSGLVVVHPTGDGAAVPMFALEDEMQGKNYLEDYASGDRVQVWLPYRGDQVNAILADGESVVIGDMLSSNGDGKLQKHAGDASMAIVAIAMEAVDLSDSSAADPDARIIAMVV